MGPASFAARAQLDAGVWYGLAVSVALGLLARPSPEEAQHALLAGYLAAVRLPMRAARAGEVISDRQLLDDYVVPNAVTCFNAVTSCPLLYFMYHRFHDQTVATSVLRSITGTIRVIPGMCAFYAAIMLVCPAATALLMRVGRAEGAPHSADDYRSAKRRSVLLMVFTVLTALESWVELRGIGVASSAITAKAFLCFCPTLSGRLACSVAQQQMKVGEEFECVLPAAWACRDAPEVERRLHALFTLLGIDAQFFIGVIGTSVFQHGSNAIGHILLSKGGAAFTLRDVGRYFAGGIDGTLRGSAKQVWRTVCMRFGFMAFWNWQSTCNRRLQVIESYPADRR